MIGSLVMILRYQNILELLEINVNKYFVHLLVKHNGKVLDIFSSVYYNYNVRCLKWFPSAHRHMPYLTNPLHCRVLLVKFKMLHPNSFGFSAQLHCEDFYCAFCPLTSTRSNEPSNPTCTHRTAHADLNIV